MDRTAGGDEELPRSGEPAEEPETPVRRPAAGSQAEQDAIFAALVAQFDDPVDLTDPRWPEIENLRAREDLNDFAPEPRPRPSGPSSGTSFGRGSAPFSGPLSDPISGPLSGPRDYEVAEDPDDDHFVPPEPPPLPPADTTARFAWLAVLGGPALLVFDAMYWHEVAGWPAWVGGLGFLGGFVTLIARMKDRGDDPSDPNDGAVV